MTDQTLIVYVDDTFTRTSTTAGAAPPTGGAYTIQGTAANYAVERWRRHDQPAQRRALPARPCSTRQRDRCRRQLPRPRPTRSPSAATSSSMPWCAATAPTSTASSCAWRPTAQVFVSASTVDQQRRDAHRQRGPGARPDPHRQHHHPLPRAGQRQPARRRCASAPGPTPAPSRRPGSTAQHQQQRRTCQAPVCWACAPTSPASTTNTR